MTIFFYLKMFKISCVFHELNKKLGKRFLFLRDVHLSRERQILTIRKRTLVIGIQCVNKHPRDFKLHQGTNFPNHFDS